jgi:exodeoxyribonuclease 7 large subunit
MYEVYAQQVDQLRLKLMQGMQQRLHLAKQQLMQFTHRLQLVSPEQLLIQQKQKLEWLQKQLLDSNQNYLQDKQIRFQQLVEKLDLLSPLKIMTRGYGIVFKNGTIVNSVEQIENNEEIEIRLSDGLVNATVNEKNKESL